MSPSVHKRRKQVGRLLRYLFGPGRQEEHVNPHLVAAWNGAGELASLEPAQRANGSRDVRQLTRLLRQPLHAARNAPALTVWHCSIRNAPEDPILSDEQWAEIAAEVMHAVKLAPHGDPDAVRWVAVRHNDDHGVVYALRSTGQRCGNLQRNAARLRRQLYDRIPSLRHRRERDLRDQRQHRHHLVRQQLHRVHGARQRHRHLQRGW